jgi:hypothetical protein
MRSKAITVRNLPRKVERAVQEKARDEEEPMREGR